MTTTDAASPATTTEPVAGAAPPATSGATGSGPPDNPRWVRAALLVLLLATAALYLVGLSASGWANAYYSAAAQAGSQSWSAWFFGAIDAAGSITVDKPPAALWLMGLSVRLFGLSSWSVLLPQALAGVASVAVLFAAVRRTSGPVAGLVAGAVLALTPIATLMFRFNNPDALLVLLLTGAAYAVVRALEAAATRWLVLAGVLVGFGFLTKMLQAFLVLPAFTLAYLVAAPTPAPRRVRQLLAAALAAVVSAGWWVAAVELTPASLRPYVGGSQTDSVLELMLGYNGFGRVTGEQTGSVGGAPGGGWGETGWTRLLDAEWGAQASWLLPAALLLLGAGLWVTRRSPRTDPARAALLLWGGWLVVTAAVFSLAAGIIHPYYSVALVPATAALVGIGGTLLWARRHDVAARSALAATVLVSTGWAYALLARSPQWYPGLRVAVVTLGALGAIGLLLGSRLRLAAAGAVLSLSAVLLGPAAYSLQTAATGHSGALPSAGPAVTASAAGLAAGPGGAPGARPGGRPDGQGLTGQPPARGWPGGAPGGLPSLPGGTTGGTARGGMGGLLEGSEPSAELVALLSADADGFTWAAAAVGANAAAGYQLATGSPVMALGGFNGTDPSPTLEQFLAYVAAGRIHWFIGGGGFGPASGGSQEAAQIAAWVSANVDATTVDGVTLYDLSGVVEAASTAAV